MSMEKNFKSIERILIQPQPKWIKAPIFDPDSNSWVDLTTDKFDFRESPSDEYEPLDMVTSFGFYRWFWVKKC